jgi:hypothetical protein
VLALAPIRCRAALGSRADTLAKHDPRDETARSNFGLAIKRVSLIIWVWVLGICCVLDLIGSDMRIIFYLWVIFVSDLNQDGYETDIFSHSWIIRWVPDTLLPL